MKSFSGQGNFVLQRCHPENCVALFFRMLFKGRKSVAPLMKIPVLPFIDFLFTGKTSKCQGILSLPNTKTRQTRDNAQITKEIPSF